MTTEHRFILTEKTATDVEYGGSYYELGVDGNLSNGVPFYKLEGHLESEVLEIGDVFKEFKDITGIVLDSANLGAFRTNNSTSAAITDTGDVLTISGYMPASDNTGIRTEPFLMNRNRYFEWIATDTNRYIYLNILPENSNTSSAKTDYVFYMLSDNMVANVTYRVLIDVNDKIAYVYNEDTLILQKSLAGKDFSKPHRVVIASSSTRNHTLNLRYSRDSFNYRIPSGYLTLNEEGTLLEGIEIYTSTSMDGTDWEGYRALSDSGKVLSSVGKFLKLRMKIKPYIEEVTFKEYDYINKDESSRVWAVDNLVFTGDGLTPKKELPVTSNRYMDGSVVMYRSNINNRDFRVDGLSVTIEEG